MPATRLPANHEDVQTTNAAANPDTPGSQVEIGLGVFVATAIRLYEIQIKPAKPKTNMRIRARVSAFIK